MQDFTLPEGKGRELSLFSFNDTDETKDRNEDDTDKL